MIPYHVYHVPNCSGSKPLWHASYPACYISFIPWTSKVLHAWAMRHGPYVGLINSEIPSRNFSWRIKTDEPVFYCPLVFCIIQHMTNFICGLIQFLNYRHNLAYIQFNVYPHYFIEVFSMQL